ncbi:Uncharacterized protein FWK35_00026931, partial [Aphis craccivora]
MANSATLIDIRFRFCTKDDVTSLINVAAYNFGSKDLGVESNSSIHDIIHIHVNFRKTARLMKPSEDFFYRSTRQNYLDLGVLPIRSLYKKIVIMFIFKRLIKKNSISFYINKRENIFYNIPVKYSKKSFGQSFVMLKILFIAELV